jgi:hypothetical protein
MTKLSTEAKAELQRMIDIGATHMRAQGRCSSDEDGTCLYRGPNGTKCFIGALIADEHYHSGLEKKGVQKPSNVRALLNSGYKLQGLIPDLQAAQEELHDNLDFSEDFPAAFEAALVSYCSEYGLDYTAPEETL